MTDDVSLLSVEGLEVESVDDNPRVQGVGVGGSIERRGKYTFEDLKLFGVTDFL